jgi:4'-phosphopantetheinyl transferase EntD
LPLFYSHTIDQNTRLAVWRIKEDEAFFLEKVPVSRSITHPHKRLQHLAGRYLLQYLFPEFPIHLIQIADTRKPFLENESHHFSISHCGDYAAAIVSTGNRVGIDIEQHSDRIFKVQHKFLTPHEAGMQHLVGDIFPTLIWSVKEAMYKWYSFGEIDFQEHLQVKKISVKTNNTGRIEATVNKHDPVLLQLPYVLWNDIVLTWIWM